MRNLRKEAIDKGYSSAEGKLNVDTHFEALPFALSDLNKVATKTGLYQIFTDDGTPLKVGIATNLRARLRQHVRSAQKYLSFKTDAANASPTDVTSKRSILAKHLYFDQTLTNQHDLRLEADRQRFLMNDCYVLITYTQTRELARELEKKLENKRIFRYQGKVQIR